MMGIYLTAIVVVGVLGAWLAGRLPDATEK
jgi:hypothetical protein